MGFEAVHAPPGNVACYLFRFRGVTRSRVSSRRRELTGKFRHTASLSRYPPLFLPDFLPTILIAVLAVLEELGQSLAVTQSPPAEASYNCRL